MTPKQYVDEICRPNVQEFVREPTSVRRAWAACVSLYHFVDYAAADQRMTVKSLSDKFAKGFSDFKKLEAVANASKHFQIDRNGPRKGLSSANFKTGKGAAFSDGTYFSDGTTFTDACDVIRVEFDGEVIDIVSLCRRGLAFIETQMAMAERR